MAGAHPPPGQEWEAAGLRELLRGGSLLDAGASRRLQDPLSFRCASHVHGTLRWALDVLATAVLAALNGAGDNPLVLGSGAVVSTGNFHTPALALALDTAAIAVAQTAGPAAERPARLATERLSGLPANLTRGGEGRSGIAPLLEDGAGDRGRDPPPRRAARRSTPASAPTASRTTRRTRPPAHCGSRRSSGCSSA